MAGKRKKKVKPVNVTAPDDCATIGYEADPGNALSYVGEDIIESPAWGWQHSLAEILGALLDAGLRITSIDEHAVTMFRQFPGMVRGDDGLWRMPFDDEVLPLIFTLTATRY